MATSGEILYSEDYQKFKTYYNDKLELSDSNFDIVIPKKILKRQFRQSQINNF